jgi:hypothetical protein
MTDEQDFLLYSMFCVWFFLRRLNCMLGGSVGGPLYHMSYPILFFSSVVPKIYNKLTPHTTTFVQHV